VKRQLRAGEVLDGLPDGLQRSLHPRPLVFRDGALLWLNLHAQMVAVVGVLHDVPVLPSSDMRILASLVKTANPMPPCPGTTTRQQTLPPKSGSFGGQGICVLLRHPAQGLQLHDGRGCCTTAQRVGDAAVNSGPVPKGGTRNAEG